MIWDLQEKGSSGGFGGVFVFDGFDFAVRVEAVAGLIGFEAAPIHGLPVVEGVYAIAPPATVFDVAVVLSGPPPLGIGVDSAGRGVDFVQEVLVRGVATKGLDVEGDEVGVYARSQPFGQGGDGRCHWTPPVLVKWKGSRKRLGGLEGAFRRGRGVSLVSARLRAIPVRLV